MKGTNQGFNDSERKTIYAYAKKQGVSLRRSARLYRDLKAVFMPIATLANARDRLERIGG